MSTWCSKQVNPTKETKITVKEKNKENSIETKILKITYHSEHNKNCV